MTCLSGNVGGDRAVCSHSPVSHLFLVSASSVGGRVLGSSVNIIIIFLGKYLHQQQVEMMQGISGMESSL